MAGTSKLEVINGALSALKIDGVNTTNNPDNTLRSILTEYDDIVRRELKHNWQWATKAVNLKAKHGADGNTIKSPYELNWIVWEKPEDYESLKNVFPQGQKDVKVSYQIDADGIHAPNFIPLAASIVVRLDESVWDLDFARVVQLAIANYFAAKYAPDREDRIKSDYITARNMGVASDGQQGGLHRELMNTEVYKRGGQGYTRTRRTE